MEIKLENLTIEGTSRSTIETYFCINELKLVFDIGKAPYHLVRMPNIFLSHMHGDHSLGLYYYISHRNLSCMEPGKIYLPKEALENTEKLIDVFSSLEMAKRSYELIPLEPDQEISYGRDYIIRTFATDHRVPSLGYLISHKKEKLKPEFLNKSQNEIIDLKRKGIPITNVVYTPLITYLGDTTIKPVDEYDFIKESKILIMECTFLISSHYDQADQRKHIHIKDIIKRADEFKNKHILLSHFSMRYSDDQIRNYLERKLPDSLKERVIAFM